MIWCLLFPYFDSSLFHLLPLALPLSFCAPSLVLLSLWSLPLSSEDYPEIQRLFPCADIQYIPDASHWIHADKPLDFISSISSFLQP